MTHHKHLTAGLIAIGISTSLSSIVSAAPEAPANFRIMDEQEITAHTGVMKSLQGSAREEYRNSHYKELQERARRQGYQMPAEPPWAAKNAGTTAQADPSPAMPIAREQAATDAAVRHAAMREKLKALTAAQSAPKGVSTQTESPVDKTQTADQAAVSAPVVPVEAPPLSKPSAETSVPAPEPPTLTKRPGFTAPAAPVAPIAPAPVDAQGPAPRIDTPAPRVAATPGRFAVQPMPPEIPNAAGDMQPGTSADASDAMTAYREAMRSRFDAFMRNRQAQYEEDLRRQREQMAAARQQNRSTQQPLPGDTFRLPPYPGMPVWAPPYPMAFPGYREPYSEQR